MIDRKVCPECGSGLGKTAYKCRCGWKAKPEAESRPFVPCAFAGCGNPALVRRKDGNSDVNLCTECLPRWWTPERIKSHGINRGEKDNAARREVRQAFQRSRYSRIKEERGVDAAKAAMRIPGEDDERVAA